MLILMLKKKGILSALKHPARFTCWIKNLWEDTWQPLLQGLFYLQIWTSEVKDQSLDWKLDEGFPTLARCQGKDTSFWRRVSLQQQGPFNSLCRCLSRVFKFITDYALLRSFSFSFLLLQGNAFPKQGSAARKHPKKTSSVNDLLCPLLICGKFPKDTVLRKQGALPPWAPFPFSVGREKAEGAHNSFEMLLCFPFCVLCNDGTEHNTQYIPWKIC